VLCRDRGVFKRGLHARTIETVRDDLGVAAPWSVERLKWKTRLATPSAEAERFGTHGQTDTDREHSEQKRRHKRQLPAMMPPIRKQQRRQRQRSQCDRRKTRDRHFAERVLLPDEH